MSQSNAAAIRRRTNIQTSTSPVSNVSSQNQNGSNQQTTGQNVNSPGLTLPQVIALVDKRLINLESFAKDAKDKLAKPQEPSKIESKEPEIPLVTEVELNTVIDEFNHRFELLATEINDMKDILLKLQSYTMDVNKMLVEERIHILSSGVDLSDNDNEKLVISSSILDNFDESANSSVDLRDLVKKELEEQSADVVFSIDNH